MRRPTTLSLLGVALAAVLAACADGTPVTSPSALRPSLAITIGYPTTCSPNAIRQTMGTLFTTSDLKRGGTPLFNEAEQLKQAGNLPAARVKYFELVDYLLEAYKGDRLQQSSQLTSAQEGVFFVVASALLCAGDEPIGDALKTMILRLENDAPNYQLCVVLFNADGSYRQLTDAAGNPRQPMVDTEDGRLSCVPPSKGVAVKIDGGTTANPGYLTKPALILVYPDFTDGASEDVFEEDLGTTWSGVWQIRFEPKDAQKNFGGDPVVGDGPFAHTAVCTVEQFGADDPHHFMMHENLLRVGYHRSDKVGDAKQLPVSTVATGLLDCLNYKPDFETDALASSLGGRSMRGLRDAGGQLARLFTPTTLYAFDGGIGGSVRSSLSYYSAVEKNGVYVRRASSTETQGPLAFPPGVFDLTRSTSLAAAASRTAFGVIRPPASCTWASSHNRVRVNVSTSDNTLATLAAGNSTGLATVTATCTFNGVISSTSIVVNVVR